MKMQEATEEPEKWLDQAEENISVETKEQV